MSTTDRIEKQIELKAPVSRVWKALTDYRQFGEWFGVQLEGPFVPGETTQGPATYSDCGQKLIQMRVQTIEPERLFAYHWSYTTDSAKDHSKETPTLVEFRLEATATGTRLTVIETGFDKLPAEHRDEAFRKHTEGWAGQMDNIARYLLSPQKA